MTSPCAVGLNAPPRGGPSRPDPRDLLESALDFAELLLDDVMEPAVRDPECNDAVIGKSAGELAMLLRLAHRVLAGQPGGVRVLELATRLAPLARSGTARRELILRPSRSATYGLAHCCLSDIGLVDPAFHALVLAAFGAAAARAVERVPYRLLDAAWARHLVLGDAELAHPATELTPIGVGVDLLRCTTEDAYAFTHALPYATDFARVPLPQWADRESLSAVADVLCVKALRDNDLDVLAEALMAPAILRTPWSAVQQFGWLVLEKVWTRYGYVPGPGIPEAPPGEDRPAAVARVIGTVYHTTLAAGLCVATFLGADAAPPQARPWSEGERSWQTPQGPARAWRDVWDELAPGERMAQGEFVFLYRLLGAIEERDLLGVVSLIRAGVGDGRGEHPLVVQAAELIERSVLAAPLGEPDSAPVWIS